MAEQTFKVGDRVRVLAGGEGVITYGPVNSTFDTYKMFVVKQDGDDERAFKAGDLAPLARFEIGDRVTVLHTDGVHAIAAGPFRGLHGDNFYVYAEEADEGEDTTHSVAYVSALRPADPEPTTNIKVGDRVRVLRAKWAEGTHGKVGTVLSVTETFRADVDDLHPYDIELDDGDTVYAAEVEPVPVTVTYEGVEYDLTAEYRDDEGDFWKFEEGQVETGGNARMSFRLSGITEYLSQTMTLSYVVDAYGPLTQL
ncbi:phiSA1p31-related protein [Streptomyces diastaticus]|uniref:phiSA1p31-related protein n=1 Tax=Streptomyces diastaticus TaxID=1956 RepID=UPI00378C6DFE